MSSPTGAKSCRALASILWNIETILKTMGKHRISVKNRSYLQNRNRLIDIEIRLVVDKGRGGRGMDWELGVGTRQLLYIGQINNKVLLYSTGDYIQYTVINHIGKEYKKRMSIYV